MNKLMLLGGAALIALSGTAMAQSTASEPVPDAAAAAPAPPPTDSAASAEVAPAAPAAAPTVAQSTEPAADAAAATPAAPASATANASPPATPTAPAAATADAAAATPSPAAPASASADASAKVSADWAKYDEGNKGKLTPLEFGSWVLAKNGQDVTAQVEKTKTSKKANLPAIKVLNATSAEFAKADKDKDRMISPDELASYLSA